MEINLSNNKKTANKGITLIALVITIIVLLILAGVSIAMLTGENGILTQANDAKTDTEIGEEKEQIRLAYNAAKIAAVVEGKSITATGLNAEFVTNGVNATASGSNPIKVVYGENTYTINETTGEITGPTTEEVVTGKWSEPYDIEGFTHIEGEWDTGYVIQDNVTKSEFVWIPVGGTINGTTINLERTFYDDNLMTDAWVSNMSGGAITSIDTFISMQFGFETKAAYWNAFAEVADYIEDFIDSVEENGGFYIGRYEASYLGGKVATVESTGTPRTSSSTTLTDGMLWNYISQTDALAKCEEMYDGHESGINSKLVNSYAWDTALKFIEVVEGKNVDTDSTEWGNYYDDEFSNTDGLINTGAFEETKACNIYDLAGNVLEWTTENIVVQGATSSVYRGGDCSDDGALDPAGVRVNVDPSFTNDYFGFRPLLFK